MSDENWKAPASPRVAAPTSHGCAASQGRVWATRCTPSSKASAAHPNSAQMARYPAAKQASSRPGRAWRPDTSANSRRRGTADGSIMAPTITHHTSA